jgi:hypothetical protein
LVGHRPLEFCEVEVVFPLQTLDTLLQALQPGLGLVESLLLEPLLQVLQVLFGL